MREHDIAQCNQLTLKQLTHTVFQLRLQLRQYVRSLRYLRLTSSCKQLREDAKLVTACFSSHVHLMNPL